MYSAPIILILLALALATAAMVRKAGPFERLVAANLIGSLCVILLALICFALDRQDFIDLAITYALLNGVAAIALVRYFRTTRANESRPRRGGAGPRASGGLRARTSRS